MNKQLAIYLYNKLIALNLPFLDVVCAMVQTQTEDMPTSEETATMNVQRYPVALTHNQTNCESGKEFPAIPDGNKKSLLYFEDNGIGPITLLGRAGFQSSIRLVYWCNRARLIEDGYSETLIGQIEQQLIELLVPRRFENTAGFVRLLADVNRLPAQDAGIFSKYSYKETDKQYLRPPYDFFAIDFTFKYNIGSGCQVPIIYEPASCL